MKCFVCSVFSENPNFRTKREKIKQFNLEILFICKQFLKAGKYYGHKYNNVVLPDNCDDTTIGYHSTCYKDFVVKKSI